MWNQTVYTPGIVTWMMLRSSTPAAVFTSVFVVVLAVLAILDELFFPKSKRINFKNFCRKLNILNVIYRENIAK